MAIIQPLVLHYCRGRGFFLLSSASASLWSVWGAPKMPLQASPSLHHSFFLKKAIENNFTVSTENLKWFSIISFYYFGGWGWGTLQRDLRGSPHAPEAGNAWRAVFFLYFSTFLSRPAEKLHTHRLV